ncbi:glycosyltransferase family 2 protein [Polynucleobacter sp. AM-26B4]|uniref:glycosyltransferase family 2 protein n=1 Tax=Polynucleobacter sp. AM-26B4 TaxID=2689103 RepID=UPI001C0AB041|nr:glycosyltransferase family 2 protein [Polynucleobacter sp. AM-26B4]
MATKNGERFLADQLDSLADQSHQNWVLIASDDGSTDNTVTILKSYQAKWPAGKLIIKEGPKQGFCVNFLSMACDPAIRADYYAFCDQDDVWLSKKLTVAIKNIAENEKSGFSYVYCGRTAYVDERLKKIGCSPQFSFPRTFRNALIQNVAGGNTMVFNQFAKNALEKVGIVRHPSHDWWLYQLITGMGGLVFYDSIPQVLYRQHKDSLVGGNTSFLAKMKRTLKVFNGQFRCWSDQNIVALFSAKELLTHGSLETLELFEKMRHAKLKDRFRLLEVAGLYRQTWRGTISLLLAALFKKI